MLGQDSNRIKPLIASYDSTRLELGPVAINNNIQGKKKKKKLFPSFLHGRKLLSRFRNEPACLRIKASFISISQLLAVSTYEIKIKGLFKNRQLVKALSIWKDNAQLKVQQFSALFISISKENQTKKCGFSEKYPYNNHQINYLRPF